MIIDCILDRADGAVYGEPYCAEKFYRDMLSYGPGYGHKISAAMDYGTESDVRRVLCEYIDTGYNPLIKDYINAVNWLEDCTPGRSEINAAVTFRIETEKMWAVREALARVRTEA